MSSSAVQHAFSSVSRTRKLVAAAVAMLATVALVVTDAGAASATVTPAPAKTTLELHLTSATGAAVKTASILFFPENSGDISYFSLLLGAQKYAPAIPVAGKPGTFTVDFTDLGGAGRYSAYLEAGSTIGTAGQYLGGADNAADATYLDIHQGANAANISFAASGTISGTVKTSSGKAPSGVCVELYEWNGVRWIAQSTLFGLYQCVAPVSAKTGKYSVNPGAAGSYKVQFVSDTGAYATQFSDGSYDLDSAPSFYLSAGESAVVNSKLQASGKFTGTLVSSTSKPIKDAYVYSVELEGNAQDGYTVANPDAGLGIGAILGGSTDDGVTDKHGSFTLGGIHNGPYALAYGTFDDSTDGEVSHFIGGPDATHATVFTGQTAKTVKLGTLVGAAPSAPAPTGTLDVTLTGTEIPSDPTAGVGFISPAQAIDSRPTYTAATKTLHFTDVPQGTVRLISIPPLLPDGEGDDDGGLQLAPPAYLPTEQDLVIGAGSNTATIDFSPVTDLVFTSEPELSSDAPTIGSAISVTDGTVNHSLPDSTTTYQWYREVDGVRSPIFAAKTASYTPRGVDAGAHLSVKVTNTFGFGFAGVQLFSQRVSTVVEAGAAVPTGAQLTNTLAPQLASGSTSSPVGIALTATGSTWSEPGVRLAYAWQRDGVTIDGANGPTYTPTADDFGASVTATVVASKAGFPSSAAVSSNAVSITTGAAPTVVTAPKISVLSTTNGEGPASRTFRIADGTWSADGLDVTYVWTADDASGTPVTGTGTSFTTTTSGAVTVTATATSDAREPGIWTGLAQRGTVPVPSSYRETNEVPNSFAYDLFPVNGTIAYQQVTGAETQTVTWQRLVGTKWTTFVSKDGAHYFTTLKDLGTQFRAITTWKSPYYATVSATTAAATSGSITGRSYLDKDSTATIEGPLTVGSTLSAESSGFPVDNVTHTYRWMKSTNGGVSWGRIPYATNKTFLIDASLAVGTQLRATVYSSAPGWGTTSKHTAPVTIVAGQTRIENLGAPTVTPRDLRAGRTATASTGSWSVTGVTFSYDWRIDGTSTGATDKTYRTDATAAGHELTVAVTAHKAGYTDSTPVVTDPITLRDAAAKSTHPTSFSLSAVQYGSHVEAGNPVSIFGLDPDADDYVVTYQWKLDGKAIARATASSYAPTATQIGRKLSVTVTLRSDVYGTATATSKSAIVRVGDALPLFSSISSSATPVVPGVVLTAQNIQFFPLSIKYQWQSSRDGLAWASIAGATGSTYTVGTSLVGQQVRVVATGTKKGYLPSVADSSPVTVESSGTLSNLLVPSLGSPKVGAALTAVPGTWNFSGASYTYQWLLDGVVIPGATSATFSPAPKFAGRELSVRVTASRAGYVSGVATSDTESIAFGDAAVATLAPKISGGCTTPFVVSPGTWSVSNITETYQWTVDGVPVTDATATSFAKPASGGVAVVITVAAPGYATAVSTVTASPTCI